MRSALLAIAALACSPAPLSGPPPRGPTFGERSCLAIPGVEVAARSAVRLRDAGVRWVRWDLRWFDAELAPGVFDFSGYDAGVDALVAHGIQSIAILAYGNPIYSGRSDGDFGYPPTDPAPFGAFAAAAAAHYGDRVARFELWNEPNLGERFFKPTADAVRYARMARSAADACPACPLILGGLNWHYFAAMDFLNVVIATEPALLPRLRGTALHPYPIYPPAVSPEDASAGQLPMAEMIARFRGAAGAAELHLTEIGWPTSGEVDDAAQSRYLARSMLIAAEADARTACWYTLHDGPDHGAIIPEGDFGLLRYDGTEKLAWRALATLLRELGPLGFSERVPSSAGSEILRFRDVAGTRAATALWRSSPSGPDEASVSLTTGAARLVQLDGTESKLEGDEAVVALGLDPVLVMESR